MNQPPTLRQLEVLGLIVRLTGLHGCPPTIREIGAQLGIRSTNAVVDHLVALEKKGLLERHCVGVRAARAFRVTPLGKRFVAVRV